MKLNAPSEGKMRSDESVFELPIYGLTDAARYLRLPYQTLRYWTRGRGTVEPMVRLADAETPRLSFVNLMECHMLSAMRTHYDIHLPKVRRALQTLRNIFPSSCHPLIEHPLETDAVNLFIRENGEIINLNRAGQLGFKDLLEMHLRRIARNPDGTIAFFPFVEKRAADEPKIIMMNPAISFGRPVITGTAIPTALIASRFHARESIGALAKEYGRTDKEIEEAIRWESRTALAA